MQTTQIDQAAIERLAEIGGKKLVCQMIELFLTHVPQRIEAMLQARTTGDLEAIEKAAHSIKSSAANLGAMNLFRFMDELEHLCSKQQQASVRGMFAPTLTCFEQVKHELETLHQTWAKHEDTRHY